MRKEEGIIFFDDKQEEVETIKDFQGIFVTTHPVSGYYAEILEIISKAGIQRPIGLSDIAKYSLFVSIFKPDEKQAIEIYKNSVIKTVAENYPPAIENGIPEIAISVELEKNLFGSYKSKK